MRARLEIHVTPVLSAETLGAAPPAGASVADLDGYVATALVEIIGLVRVTQNLVGRLVAIDPATIQGFARQLIARRLFARALDPIRRRMAVLKPTEAGRNLALAAISAARTITAATLAPLDEAERLLLLATLRKLG